MRHLAVDPTGRLESSQVRILELAWFEGLYQIKRCVFDSDVWTDFVPLGDRTPFVTSQSRERFCLRANSFHRLFEDWSGTVVGTERDAALR
jgi:hypothetical protein